jgi:hypothetical protein
MAWELLLYDGCCKRCGKNTNGFATTDTRNPLTHRHIPVTIDPAKAEKWGFKTVPVPPGLRARPLGLYGKRCWLPLPLRVLTRVF